MDNVAARLDRAFAGRIRGSVRADPVTRRLYATDLLARHEPDEREEFIRLSEKITAALGGDTEGMQEAAP